MQSSTYRLELTVHGIASGQDEIVLPSVAEVETFVAKSLVPDSVLIVTHQKNDADYGNFIIFLNVIGLAYIRVLEHRGFYATKPQGTTTGRTVQFQFADGGGTFDVDEHSTIPRATAVEALNHWLATGKRTPDVCWIDE